MESPFHSHIRISCTRGGLAAWSSIDGEIDIHIQFKIVGQAVIELEIRGILPEIRVLKLESVIFIEEFEVPLPRLGDPGVIGIERQLSMQRLGDEEHAGNKSRMRIVKRMR